MTRPTTNATTQSTPHPTIRLLIADDEDLLRSALAALLALEEDLSVVAEAATSTDAVRLAREHRPDIAVLDLEMPPADGLRAAEEIRAELPTQVVLVTRHARPAVLRRALAAGVRGFVPKTTPAARLAEIIRDIAAGRRYVDPDIAASALTEDDCPLTDRELEVLRAARTGASIAEIAGEVHLAPGTVRNYLSAAMSKLGAPTRHAAAHRAWEQGWI
ncbi:response regulator transcription factor [Streptomyces sp. Lzd4kr]|nr:response regulator transcription factor [Streptomyces sp. Lzd4kr]